MSLLFTAEFGGPLLLVLGVAATIAAMLMQGPLARPLGWLGAALLLCGLALTVLLVFREVTR
ncbi:MAG: hypothetical protein NBV67_09870 [Tagaea sp.]|nr:hypothetical protein [Tagaea sp.]